MRLVSLKIAGFRGFAHTQTFGLDADAVVIVGVNGQGKTSFSMRSYGLYVAACRGWGAMILVSFQCTRRVVKRGSSSA